MGSKIIGGAQEMQNTGILEAFFYTHLPKNGDFG